MNEECPICGYYELLQRHHMKYGENPIIIEICETCHGDFHEEFYYNKKERKFVRRKKRISLEWIDKVLNEYNENNKKKISPYF